MTQDDPFFTGRFFASFLDESAHTDVELVEIALLPNFDESKPALLRRLWSFYGAVDLLRLAARYCATEVSDLRGAPRSVEAIAGKSGVAVRHLRTINDSAYLASVSERGIDVLLSVSAPQIFGIEALGVAPFALNVHSGKLPEYRGMVPTFWALASGDDRVTVTVHEMVQRLDAGPIVYELEVEVAEGDTVFSVAARAKDVAGRGVARLLSRIDDEERASWHVPDTPPRPAFRFPTKRDVRRLRSRGRRLL